MKQRSPIVIVICLALIALAALSLYFGALLPFLKGRTFIAAQHNLRNVRTVEDFRMNFNPVFDLYSPVGTEEITKFLGSSILGNVAGGQSEEASRQLVKYIEPRLFKDDVRHLILAAQMRQTLWQKFDSEEDYLAAVDYYRQAQEIGPNLPPPLYGLLRIYAAHGDVENTRRIGEMILEKWPQDEDVRELVESLESS